MAAQEKKVEISFVGSSNMGTMLRGKARLVLDGYHWEMMGVWRSSAEGALESLARELGDRYLKLVEAHNERLVEITKLKTEVATLKAAASTEHKWWYPLSADSYEDVRRDRDQLRRDKQDVTGRLQALQLEIAKLLDAAKEE